MSVIPWIQAATQEATQTPLQENDDAPCADHICEECPHFQAGTCDTVMPDQGQQES